MWLIFLSLGVGILIGLSNIIPKKILKYNDKATLIGVLVLLFIMGIGIGIDKDILNNLKIVGINSFVFGFFTILFSIIIVYLLTLIFFKGGKK